MTKREEVSCFVQAQAETAIAKYIVGMVDRESAEVIRQRRFEIARDIAYQVSMEYSFLELSDIMEWKRSRVRR